MAPHVDFQPTRFVILLVTAWERARELLLLPEVGPIVGEQRAHCDERPFTAGEVAAVGPLGLQVAAAAVGGEAGGAGEALPARLALVRRLLLVGAAVGPQVVDGGEALGAAGRGAGEGPQFVVRVQLCSGSPVLSRRKN